MVKKEKKRKEEENKEKNKENKEKNKGKRMSKNTRLIIIFLSIAVVILFLLIMFILFQTQITSFYNNAVGNVFVYQGMTFQKERLGTMNIYSTELAIQGKDSQTRYFLLHLLNDPRRLFNEKNITRKIQSGVYVSFTNSTLNCSGTSLAGYKLGEFATALGAKATGALTDYARAIQDLNESGNYTEEMILERVKNCSDSKYNSVIILDAGYNETRIFNDFSAGEKSNCYIIQAKNCETAKAAEMFILDLINVMQIYKETENTNNTKTEEVITEEMPKDTTIMNLSEMLNVSEEEIISG